MNFLSRIYNLFSKFVFILNNINCKISTNIKIYNKGFFFLSNKISIEEGCTFRIEKSSEIEIRKFVNKLYMIKKSIMDSFNESVKKFENSKKEAKTPGDILEKYPYENNILVQSRQLGWGSFGSLMRRIIQEKDGEAKLKKSLLVGLNYNENMSSSMVSLDIIEENKKYPIEYLGVS